MSSITPRLQPCGFALTEALVALLLLAIVMMGTGMALIESLAGQRSALLRTRAADLVGNLAEALRSAPDMATAQAEIRAWQSEVALQLPRAQPRVLQGPMHSSPASLPESFDIELQWHERNSLRPSRLVLSVALPTGWS